MRRGVERRVAAAVTDAAATHDCLPLTYKRCSLLRDCWCLVWWSWRRCSDGTFAVVARRSAVTQCASLRQYFIRPAFCFLCWPVSLSRCLTSCIYSNIDGETAWSSSNSETNSSVINVMNLFACHTLPRPGLIDSIYRCWCLISASDNPKHLLQRCSGTC